MSNEQPRVAPNLPATAHIDLGIRGEQVYQSAHVVYFWETHEEFTEAIRFLETGLRGGDTCIVFGHDEANDAVTRVLENNGFALQTLLAQQRLVILGGDPSADSILQTIAAAFSAALSRGAPLIRLLGNIGWGKRQWPDDHQLLAFEAKVTDAARQFPCVIVCMYDLISLSGHIIHKGGFEAHPYVMFGSGPLRDNPDYVPAELFRARIESLARDVTDRKRHLDAIKRSEEQFRSLFENSIDAVLLSTPEGTIEAANPAACALFDRSEAEILRGGRASLVDARDPRLRTFLDDRVRTGHARGELTLLRKDGSTFLGEVSSALFQDPFGTTKASVVIRDITEHRRMEETLRHITEGTAGSTGDEFFRSLVRHLANALEVRYCFVAECTDEKRSQVRTLAMWAGDDFVDNIEYRLEGTPCERVVGGESCSYPEELQALFPRDKDLAALKIESYVGLPVTQSGGEVLGHLVAMDDKPRRFGENELSILRIFATRAGAELQRKRAEQVVAESETRRRVLLDINNAIVTKLSRDELFSAIADSVERVVAFDRLALSLYDPETRRLRIVTYAGSYRREDYTPVGRELDLNDSAAGAAFLDRRPVLRKDLATEQLTSSDERAYGHGFRSICALPLMVRGVGIGAITVGSLTPNQYGEADAEFLMEVANQISIAVDNMRSHEESETLKARFEAEKVYLQEEIKTEHNFEEIIGQSAPVRELLRKVEQVAPTEATVLIHGETGTGKELIARAVHDRSGRKDRPLVKVNCGSIPSGLVESELFGHEKGAFTGATQRRVGRFELANGGTIFLDEVTELPIDTQVKLLRVLQEGEFERVGSSQTIKVDVRVIAATNRDLQEVVRNGMFRADLFYRLNVFPLEVPSLRERKDDIPLLVNFFLSRFGKKLGKEIHGVSQKSMASLAGYGWPGNIRELQNVVERAVVLANGPVVHVDVSMLRSQDEAHPAAVETLENVERSHILRALSETGWVVHGKKGAAEILGINPSTLRSRMEKLGIKKTRSG